MISFCLQAIKLQPAIIFIDEIGMRVFFLSQDIHKLLVCFGKWDLFFSVIGHCIHKSLISLTTRGEEVIAPPLLWPVFHYKSYRIFFLAMVKVLKDSKMLCVISRFWIMALLLRLSSCFLTYPLTANNRFTITVVSLVTFVDSFLRSRSSQDHEATAMIKAQFMSMWDGIITDPNCRIMIVAATNRPSDIDPAILRRLPCQFIIKKPVKN